MKKRLTSFLLCFLMCVALLPVSAQAAETAEARAPGIPAEGDVWDGGITRPTKLVQKDGVYYYEITKCSELAYVAQTGGDWCGYNYILGNNLILNDVELIWDEDGDCTNEEDLFNWTPIGINEEFTGCFDGAGFTVSGLFIPGRFYYCGFFGRCNNAQIRNINITNTYVKNEGGYAGGVVANCYYSKIENCSFSGCAVSTQYSAGGIIGSSAENEITNCCAKGYIRSGGYAGGLTGSVNGDEISNSTTDAIVRGGIAAGGFTGAGTNLNAYIENCMSYGVVSGVDAVGGFVGLAYNVQMSNCAAFGNAVASSGAAGGFAGKTENKHYDACSIRDCFSFGDVSATTYAGGFAGVCGASISSCYSIGNVIGAGAIGGFIGEDRRIWGEDITISDCYFLKDLNYNDDLGGTSIAPSDVMGEIEGKSTGLLKTQSTFVNWDFEDVWSVSADINGGYPYLQWQEDILSEIAVSSVNMSETALSLAEGDYAYLTAAVSPFNASNKSVTWTSSDSDIATVSAAGKVTAVSAGTAVVTVTTVDGGYTATCTVTVTERLAEEYRINSITVRDNDGAVFSAIPTGNCLATVSITNLASKGNTLVFLAAYTSTGQYQGMVWVSVEDLPVGATIKVALPVDNTDGKIENLKAFTIASFSDLTPLSEAVSFLP